MDVGGLARIFLAFFLVVGFIGAAALIARKAGFAAGARAFASRRRLSLVESLPLDARRRAIILRCDGREHLLLLGPTGERVIETAIPAQSEPDRNEAATTPPSFADAIVGLKNAAGANPFRNGRKGRGADAA